MMTWWENSANNAIAAYLCYADSLPVLETRKKASKVEQSARPHMFSDIEETVNADDVVETDKRIPYVMRLPYTYAALERREMSGASVPENWRVQVFEVTSELEAA